MLDYVKSRRRRPLVLIIIGVVLFVIFFVILPGGNESATDATAAASKKSTLNKVRQSLSKYRPQGVPVDFPPMGSSNKGDQTSLRADTQGKKYGPMLRDVRKPPGTYVDATHRKIDLGDSFRDFNRSWPWCHLSSLDLHEPFEPLCPDKDSVLQSMSYGGRAGVDKPFQPRDCDMRWFNSEEICDILGKFSYVWILGDSLMRHTTSAMHTLMREDLIEGAHTKWRPNNQVDCTCDGANNQGGCFMNEAWSSREIWEQDPTAIKCPADVARIEYSTHNKSPLDADSLKGYQLIMPKSEPSKPMAFIFGTGLWNDLNVTAAEIFIEQLDDLIAEHMPWTQGPGAIYPRLFMTPSAGDERKPMQFAATQGNQAMITFEKAMELVIQKKINFDFVGTYNMTIQARSPDGTHAGRNADLTKAMFILNWLKWLEV